MCVPMIVSRRTIGERSAHEARGAAATQAVQAHQARIWTRWPCGPEAANDRHDATPSYPALRSGGDAVTVEQWSHGDTGEVPVIKDEEPVSKDEEPVVEEPESKDEEPAPATTSSEPATSDSGAEA